MTDIKKQILKELTTLEDSVIKLGAVATNAGRQTDLEVAILTEQVKKLREKNASAGNLIERSLSMLKKLKN